MCDDSLTLVLQMCDDWSRETGKRETLAQHKCLPGETFSFPKERSTVGRPLFLSPQPDESGACVAFVDALTFLADSTTNIPYGHSLL